jgi:addiction module HigA family antidote
MTTGVHELKTMDFSDVASKGTLPPVSPGEMLLEEFLKPLAWSQYRLAKKIHVPQGRIGEIIAGKRAVTPDTDLRLCRLFGLSDGWWLRLQADYDVARAKPVMSNVLADITPVVHSE